MRLGSLARLGAAVVIGALFFTEWTVVTRYLPGYNFKYAGNTDYDYLRARDQAEADAAADAKSKAAEKEKLKIELGLK